MCHRSAKCGPCGCRPDTTPEFRCMTRSRIAGSFTGNNTSTRSYKIARHPVGAAEINFGLAAILEIEDAAVFQEAPDDAAHANPAADSANARDQRALAAHDQIDLHSSSATRDTAPGSLADRRSAFILTIMRAGLPALGVARFAIDQRDHVFAMSTRREISGL